MPKFQKKPVVIEAVKFEITKEGYAEVLRFVPSGIVGILGGPLQIKTLEGMMTASPGDWIIKGVKGEFYPVKPDIFVETYAENQRIIESQERGMYTQDDEALRREVEGIYLALRERRIRGVVDVKAAGVRIRNLRERVRWLERLGPAFPGKQVVEMGELLHDDFAMEDFV